MNLQTDIFPVLGVLGLVFVVMGALLWVGWKKYLSTQTAVSPYTGLPLRGADTLHYRSMYKVNKFLENIGGYDNPPIQFKKAALCRETGRIFPECIDRWRRMKVDWSFLRQRFKGEFVSWGSLSKEQQEEIRFRHREIQGFQTEYSSPTAAPSGVEKEYAYRKPGPLYVDVSTYILLGWMRVPDSNLEVMVVKRPLKRRY